MDRQRHLDINIHVEPILNNVIARFPAGPRDDEDGIELLPSSSPLHANTPFSYVLEEAVLLLLLLLLLEMGRRVIGKLRRMLVPSLTNSAT